MTHRLGLLLEQTTAAAPPVLWGSMQREAAAACKRAIMPLPRLSHAGGQHAIRRDRLLSVLLGQVVDEVHAGSDLLRPIWAREAVCRAANLSRLVHRMSPPVRPRGVGISIDRLECALASDLAALCRLTAAPPDRDTVPCSTVLRAVIKNLVGLFEATTRVRLTTDIARISLPAYKRRALVLAAAALVASALLKSCDSPSGRRVVVSLSMLNDREARLTVADDAAGSGVGDIDDRLGAAGDLAELLEGALLYPKCRWANTVAEIAFPVRP